MSLEIIIGKNKTGKTEYLKSTYDNKIDDKILYIPAEIDLKETIHKENLGTSKNPDKTPHWKILNFINDIIIGRSFKKQFTKEEMEKLEKCKSVIDEFNKKLKNSNDLYFEEYFKCFLNVNIAEEITFEHDFINKDLDKKAVGSSGSLNYSLLKFLYEIIVNGNIKFDTGYKLVIDEIEKFSHPEMIFTIAKMIVHISGSIDVVLTTHSPLFLERVLFIQKRNLKNGVNVDIKYRLKLATENKTKSKAIDAESGFLNLEKETMDKILGDNNYRVISNVSKAFFASNLFLVEGLNDFTFLTELINNDEKLAEIYYTILDCGDKKEVKSMYDILVDLKINSLVKICLFYDFDRGGNEQKFEVHQDDQQIVNYPDLEGRFFVLKKVGDQWHMITKKEDFSKRQKQICFSESWIIENSTKPDVKDEIVAIKKEIGDFLNPKNS